MTLFMAGAIVDIVQKLVTSEISVSQLGGPIAITRMSVEAARSGLESLFDAHRPAERQRRGAEPAADPDSRRRSDPDQRARVGEGKPFSLRTREYILRFGLVAIALLFVVVMYNDTHGWFARSLRTGLDRLRG